MLNGDYEPSQTHYHEHRNITVVYHYHAAVNIICPLIMQHGSGRLATRYNIPMLTSSSNAITIHHHNISDNYGMSIYYSAKLHAYLGLAHAHPNNW